MVKFPSIKSITIDYIVNHRILIKKYKTQENKKTFFAIFLFLLAASIYGYFINKASTKGYFIRVENEKLAEIKFQNEIVKIDTKKIEGKVFNNIQKTKESQQENIKPKVFTMQENLEKFVYINNN